MVSVVFHPYHTRQCPVFKGCVLETNFFFFFFPYRFSKSLYFFLSSIRYRAKSAGVSVTQDQTRTSRALPVRAFQGFTTFGCSVERGSGTDRPPASPVGVAGIENRAHQLATNSQMC